MVRALAVIMPGNDISVGQRKDTNLNVRADNDGFDAFHLVVGHLDAFRPNQGMFGISIGADDSARKPTTGIAGCCTRAASGHVAAVPPSSVMNSRRFS
jgi:hypothetical protein